MRVLIVNRHIDHIAGGSEAQCHEIAEALVERRHAVTYAICRPEGGVRQQSYATYPLRGRFGTAFRQALRDVKPNLVYWRYNKRHLLTGVLAARRRGICFVFAVSHANDMKTFSAKPVSGHGLTWPRRALRAARRVGTRASGALNAAALAGVDAFVFQHAGQVPPGLRARHLVVHNIALRAGQADRSSGPAPTAPPTSTPFVLWVSNLKKSKNPEDFVRLAADLEDTGVEFCMVGGVQDSAYRRLVSGALPANLHYLGRQDESTIDALMSRCLFLAHTCEPEGFPNVFIRAWTRGKAVVSERFDPGGLLAEHGIGLCSSDYESFRANVERLIADSRLRDAIGSKAAAFAAEHCDRDRNMDKLERFLLALGERGGR